MARPGNALVDYTDADGRLWRMLVPSDCPKDMHHAGIVIGPPDFESRLAERGWPKEARVRLHNQLYQRRLFTIKDVNGRAQELEAVLKATLKTNMQTLHRWYIEEGK